MWRTPATLRGPLDDVPNAGGPCRLILALETSCDDTCAARRRPRRDDRGRTSSPRRASTTATAASCPRSPRATTSSSSTTSSTTRCARAGATLDDVDLRRRHAGPGPRRRAAGRHRDGQGHRRRARAAAGRRSTTSRATSPRTSSGPEPFEPPFVCLVASGGHTFLARVEDHDGFEVLGRTLDDAAGEAFDKGARLLGLPYPGGPHLQRARRARATPRAFAFPIAERPRRPGLLLRRAQDGAALQGPRPGRGRRRASAAPTSPPPTSTRSSRRSPAAASARSSRPGCDRLAIGGGVAANGPLRDAAGGRWASTLCVPAARAVHRQRRDDRLAPRAASTPLRVPDYLALDAYATGERGL